ncbi:MAG: toll/interleukin-1 receptor domain-containing protein [Terriglobales bacterium]
MIVQYLSELAHAKVSSIQDAFAETGIQMTGQTVDDALAALHASFETVISARTGAWAGALRLHEMRTRATVPGSTEALAEAKRELSRESSRLCETAEARLDVLLQSSLAASERKGTIETQPSKIPANACALRVFVSYSWDTEEHKKWALALANRLREHGIDAIIDQTHLSLGARSPEFMECSVRESGRVLVVCTEIYKRRFDNREGGAGYEGHIITGEIVNEVGKNKFIPVLRNGDWKSAIPTALSGIYGVDLRNDSPDEFRKLVETLHGISHISPVGPRPAWLQGASESFDRNAVTVQEAQRRNALLAALVREFILEHDGITASEATGTEISAREAEYINRRLKEKREMWTVPATQQP